MKIEEAIKIGKEKVEKSSCTEHFNDLSNKAFEILGYTEADYYGRDELDSLKSKLHNQNDIHEMKFYKYVGLELVECSFGEAIITSEYKDDDIFIFSKMEDDKRQYYVVIIIDN